MLLKNIHSQVWEDFKDGVKNTKSSFHFPVISTIDKDGFPSSRTVVLRKIDKKNKIISFNTDIRSNKWNEIINNNKVSVSIYDTSKKTQIRILGKAIVNYKNKIWESAWNSTPRMSRECYSTPYSPSTVISKPEDIDLNLKKIKTEDYEKYKINFGRIDIHIYSLDWLYLVHSGHRRAKFIYDKEVSMVWIAP
ncbi:MAG: pyridoxamine 5'-phosphate oxidase family protein [Alphaproteobacteria bacterium]